MGSVLPAQFPQGHTGSEHLVFRKLKDETPRGWTSLHSVGLANHRRKLWAEVDFVVITDRAVLCLEVKGGNLRIERGSWYTDERRLSHTPMEQAGGAAAALRSFLRRQLGDETPTVGWGVLFPYTNYRALDPGVDPALVYDDDARATPIHHYLDRLTDHWDKNEDNRGRSAISAEESDRLLDLIAPSFDLYATLRSRVSGVREDLFRLTNEQSEYIRGFEDEARLMVRGGAGSGKTVLAMAESERFAARGDRVLLCCANGRLARDMAAALHAPDSLVVADTYGLAIDLINRGDALGRVPDAPPTEMLAVHLPEIALEALPASAPKYDALVVDEAQDVLSRRWLELFDRLLDGGMADGTWRVFLDPNQDLLLGTDPHALDELDALAGSRYRLRTNCRNTRQVATATAMLSGLEAVDTLKVDGPDVEEHWFESPAHQRSLATSTIKEWLAGGLSPDDIVVLSHLPIERSAVASLGSAELGVPIVEPTTACARDTGAIQFASISDFKGFEADAVLLTDVDDLSAGMGRYELYVAMTRARAMLAVLLDRRARATYDQLAADYVDRVRSGLIPAH